MRGLALVVVMPVKDLFGAVFFISVGMMVQPTVLSQYFWPILLLSAVVPREANFFCLSPMSVNALSIMVVDDIDNIPPRNMLLMKLKSSMRPTA